MDLTTSQPPMQPNFGHELANSLSGQIWWPSFCFNTAKNFKNFEENITSTKAKKSYSFANLYSQSNLKIAVQATMAARDCVCLCSNSIHSRNRVEQTQTREQGALKKTVIVFFLCLCLHYCHFRSHLFFSDMRLHLRLLICMFGMFAMLLGILGFSKIVVFKTFSKCF